MEFFNEIFKKQSEANEHSWDLLACWLVKNVSRPQQHFGEINTKNIRSMTVKLVVFLSFVSLEGEKLT